MERRNKILALCLALCLTLGLAACGTPGGDDGTADAPVNVSYGLSNAWDSLMPYYSVSGSNYSRLIYDKIYDRLAYVQPDGTCLPRAAESWESADDGMAIVFHLNKDAAFHDGTPVTAESWAETIALLTDPEVDTLGRTVFAGLAGTDSSGAAVAGEALGAEAVGDYDLKLTFKQPTIPEEFLVASNRDIYVLPVHLLRDLPKAEVLSDDLWLAPVGSGPCKFVSELAGSSLTLAANEDYQLGKPGFDTMTITVIDKANLLTALISGDLDYYAFGGSISEENRPVAEQAGFTVSEGTVASTFYELMLNNESIDDVSIRQAIAKALDKELLCRQSTGTLGTPTDTSILPGTIYSAPVQDTYDPDGAKALLAASGYDGRTYTLACTSARASVAALIQQDLAEVGLKVEIVTVDSATMFSGMYDGTYDMGLASHTPTSLPLWFTGSRFSEDNDLFRVGDVSRYQQLIGEIEGMTDEDVRVDLVDELEQYLDEQMPFVPLWTSRALHVESKTVTGIDYASSACCNENVWQWSKEG